MPSPKAHRIYSGIKQETRWEKLIEVARHSFLLRQQQTVIKRNCNSIVQWVNMQFASLWGLRDYGWELSQLSLGLPANFGASLHNAVAKELDSSRTEHVHA